jgi:hypothetical protein
LLAAVLLAGLLAVPALSVFACAFARRPVVVDVGESDTRQALADVPFDFRQRLLLGGRYQNEGIPFGICTGGAADAMNVILGHVRHIETDHMGDVINVESACGDVGRHEDPLLYDPAPDVSRPDDPPLVLDPEIMRVIVTGDSDDRAGIDAMSWLEPATDSNRHFLLPLPPGLDANDPELLGFYTYELRVGHYGQPHDTRWWSTAQGRFGRPLRVIGVQYPVPPLPCRVGPVRLGAKALSAQPRPEEAATIPSDILTAAQARLKFPHDGISQEAQRLAVERDATFVLASAPYSTPVLNGRALVTLFQRPKTTLCFLLYAQVVQADAASNRNVLLLHKYGQFDPELAPKEHSRQVQRDRIGQAYFTNGEIADALFALGLPDDLPLSVVAVELLPGGVGNKLPKQSAVRAATTDRDPLGSDLAQRPQRILRVSPLVAVAHVC